MSDKVTEDLENTKLAAVDESKEGQNASDYADSSSGSEQEEAKDEAKAESKEEGE